jgi:hypothetical protein
MGAGTRREPASPAAALDPDRLLALNSTPDGRVAWSTTDSNLPARRYDDKEIARLLKRATELQVREPQHPEHDGMTLQELGAIAREAGIDPALLQQAASELDTEPEEGGWGALFAGDQTSLVIERSFEGELDDVGMEGLVPLVNRAADLTGNISSVGRTLNFTGADNSPHAPCRC